MGEIDYWEGYLKTLLLFLTGYYIYHKIIIVSFRGLNYVESILNECGLSYVWLNQYFISEEWLKNSVKTCLQDQFQQTWHANIDTGSKTLNYRLFKNKFELKIISISSTIGIYLLFVALG
jgi:hypothetical protein